MKNAIQYFTALLLVTLTLNKIQAIDNVTYSANIATIIHEKCSSCHRPGQSGPFNLLTYDDVAKHSETIKAVLASGYMPPWKPVHTGIEFAKQRSLSSQELVQINRWIEADCPEGDPKQTPAAPQFPDGWSLGKPDLVIKMDKPFTIPADGSDIYRSFAFPVGLKEDKWIKAIELRPTARGAVHHALFFVDEAGTSKNQRERDGQPGMRGMNFLRGAGGDFLDRGADRLARGLGGYVPGATPAKLPGDLARFLPKGSDIIMQTHFHPTGKVETEQAELGLYFTDIAPSHLLVPIQLPPVFGAGAGIDVPAGEANYQVTDQFTLPIDVRGFEIGGHAHYICREMLMTAKLPDGKVLELLRIDDWDLDWQDQYEYKTPIDLPKGTLITASLIYDNSSNNPENPFSPPRRIAWGRESTDEMGSITLQVIAADETQRSILETEIRERTQDSIRNRIASQTGGLAAIAGGQLGKGGLMTLFDRNRDSKLQSSEIPEKFRDRLLEFADRNGDDELSAEELENSRKGIERFLNRRK